MRDTHAWQLPTACGVTACLRARRWWAARQAFGSVGASATTVATMATLWVRDPVVQAAICRWAKVWQCALHQLLVRQPQVVHGSVAGVLSAPEEELYRASRKPTQLVSTRLQQLAATAGLEHQQVCCVAGMRHAPP
jgi:hypothetical protein